MYAVRCVEERCCLTQNDRYRITIYTCLWVFVECIMCVKLFANKQLARIISVLFLFDRFVHPVGGNNCRFVAELPITIRNIYERKKKNLFSTYAAAHDFDSFPPLPHPSHPPSADNLFAHNTYIQLLVMHK